MATIQVADVPEEIINGDAPVVAGVGVAAAVINLVDDVAVLVPALAARGGVRAMRWTNNTSGFVLRRIGAPINDGSRPNKVFKNKDLNHVAKALKDRCGEVVTLTQVYNHLRKWRQKWVKVTKLKDLSGALWDDTTNAIMLDNDHYLGHCKVETCLNLSNYHFLYN
jgi:hypothetical protein